jgi:hypothetical protein
MSICPLRKNRATVKDIVTVAKMRRRGVKSRETLVAVHWEELLQNASPNWDKGSWAEWGEFSVV